MSRSRIVSVLLPWRDFLAFVAALGAFLARVAFFPEVFPFGATSGVCGASGAAVAGSGTTGSLASGSSWRKALDRFPDALHRRVAILELLHPFRSGQAVPDFNQPGSRPLRGKLRQPGLIAELFRVRDRSSFLGRGVNGDVVGFSFDRKDFHVLVSFSAAPAAITFITLVRNTSKRILQEIEMAMVRR